MNRRRFLRMLSAAPLAVPVLVVLPAMGRELWNVRTLVAGNVGEFRIISDNILVSGHMRTGAIETGKRIAAVTREAQDRADADYREAEERMRVSRILDDSAAGIDLSASTDELNPAVDALSRAASVEGPVS